MRAMRVTARTARPRMDRARRTSLLRRVRLRAGRRLTSPALIADGLHARADGYVSLGVVAGAGFVALGAQVADPVVGIVITAVILKITWDSWRTVRAAEPEPLTQPH